MDKKNINEALDNEAEFNEFKKKNPGMNKNFDNKKYGKYFDINGQIIPDLKDEYFKLLKSEGNPMNENKLKEDIENLEVTDNTTVVNQPMGAAEEESKNLWQRFIDATKTPEDAPLFGAKEQPKPEAVEEPKATNESLNRKSLKEGLDGWDEEKVYEVVNTCNEIYDLNYELENCVKGAYTGANTYSELADYIINLGNRLAEDGENLKYVDEDPEDEDEDIDESLNKKSSSKLTLDESLFENKKSKENLKEDFYPNEYDEDLEQEWADEDLEFDRDHPGKYDFTTAGQARKALQIAMEFGYRDSWRETNQVYLAGYDKSNDQFHFDESLNEASTLPTGGKDEDFDTDPWSIIFWELSRDSEAPPTNSIAKKVKVNAPRRQRYEHVDPVNDSDIRVYAKDEKGFDLAKKIADTWGVKYKIEPVNGVHAKRFPNEQLQMTLLIPEEMLG